MREAEIVVVHGLNHLSCNQSSFESVGAMVVFPCQCTKLNVHFRSGWVESPHKSQCITNHFAMQYAEQVFLEPE